MSQYRIERLDRHDRSQFDSGSSELNRYLRERASQDMRRRVTLCFVAVDDDEEVAGFYTLAATSVPVEQLPTERAKHLPRYPVVPAVLLGRLAVALAHQGKRLGAALVADALLRATHSEIMAYAMLVEAKDDSAARFYANLAFEPSRDDPRRLMRTL